MGTGPQNVTAPNAIVGDDRGNVFVTDSGNHRIKVCTYEGACRNFGGRGNGNMQFDWPRGLAMDDQNRLIVADTENSRIQILKVRYPDDDPPFAINSGLNDAWYNPSTPGQGLLITVFEDIQTMFLAWFTYDAERPPEESEAIVGEPGHRWLTAQGNFEGNVAMLDVALTSGGIFNSALPEPQTQVDGRLRIEFAGCNSAVVTYELFSSGLVGEFPIERVALGNVPYCEAAQTVR
jgi:hypothetical protein